MSNIIRIVADAVNARAIGVSPALGQDLYNLMSFDVEGAEFSTAYSRGWNGRSSFYSARSGSFPRGFLPTVVDRLRRLGVQVQLNVIRPPAPLGPSIEQCVAESGYDPDPRYAYQATAVKSLMSYTQCIAQLSTGGGKSQVARIAHRHIGRTTLFLTTRSVLLEQMREGMEERGVPVGTLGNGVWEFIDGGFNVGMVQTIAPYLKVFDEDAEREKIIMTPVLCETGVKLDKRNRPVMVECPALQNARKAGAKALKQYMAGVAHRLIQLKADYDAVRDRVIGTLQRIEFLILEEAHETGSDSYYTITRACGNAHYRLALTATPFMRSSEEASMRLMACSGPVGVRVTEKELIDSGVLATPIFRYVDIHAPRDLPSRGNWQEAQKIGIVNNVARNEHICFEAQRAAKNGLSVLILVLRQQHGKILEEMLRTRGLTTRFIFGETSRKNRQEALFDLSNGKMSVLIGSSILDVGIDVPSLGMVIMAGGGKAEEAVRQRIGRGLRAKKKGPNVTLIVDFIDKKNYYLRNHAIDRRHFVESTPGFAENILADKEDFDFSIFRVDAR